MDTRYEYRAFGALNAADDARKLVGYAAVYAPELSEDLGGFREQIAPTAFTRDLERGADVRALINHDSNFVLGRTTNGTLRLSSDARGLRVEIEPPDTSYGRDLKTLVERGDVSQMSFAFLVRDGGDSWSRAEDGTRLRTLTDCELIEVSVVTIPAYPTTQIALRSRDLWSARQCRSQRERVLWLLQNSQARG